jgi:hypothetical protein
MPWSLRITFAAPCTEARLRWSLWVGPSHYWRISVGHALSIGTDSIEVEHKDGGDRVYGRKDNTAFSFASFASSTADARQLRENLHRAHKKPLRTVLNGRLYVLTVRIADRSGEDAFTVKIDPAPKPDPAAAPRFTKTQGQYLAFIYNYTRIHGQAAKGMWKPGWVTNYIWM